MKKFLDKLRRGANNLAIGAKCALQTRKAEGYVDTGVKILIAVVLGDVAVVTHNIALGVGREEGHPRSTSVLNARVLLFLPYFGLRLARVEPVTPDI